MENLKTIKNRIKTVGSIIKATNAMRMVATVKLAKVNNKNKFSKDCTSLLFDMLSKAAKEALFDQSLDSNFWLKRVTGKTLVLVLSTDQGFCGSFNQYILECSKKTISENKGAFVEIFGKKCSSIPFNKAPLHKKHSVKDRFNIKEMSAVLSGLVFDYIVNHDVYNVFVVSGEFKNVLVQKAKCSQIFPIEENSSTDELTAVEGPKQDFIEQVFQMYLEHLFTSLITEHIICELSARTMAMDNSVKNARDMVANLSIVYNRIRQAKITQELTEIVSSIECAQ